VGFRNFSTLQSTINYTECSPARHQSTPQRLKLGSNLVLITYPTVVGHYLLFECADVGGERTSAHYQCSVAALLGTTVRRKRRSGVCIMVVSNSFAQILIMTCAWSPSAGTVATVPCVDRCKPIFPMSPARKVRIWQAIQPAVHGLYRRIAWPLPRVS
jgi:hypothetical protein